MTNASPEEQVLRQCGSGQHKHDDDNEPNEAHAPHHASHVVHHLPACPSELERAACCGDDRRDYLFEIVRVDADGTAAVVDSGYRTFAEAIEAWPEARPQRQKSPNQ